MDLNTHDIEGIVMTVKGVDITDPIKTKAEVQQSDSNPYASWGTNNDQPTKILAEIEKNEVVFRANEFNKATHMGNGLIYYKPIIENGVKRVELIQDPEIDDWMEANNINYVMKSIIENYENCGNIFPEFVMSKDRRKIARIQSKDAAWSRWGKQNNDGFVDKHFYTSDWQNPKKENWAETYVLNSFLPMEDLIQNKELNVIYRIPPIQTNRFYYDSASVEVLMNSGTLELMNLNAQALKSLMKNQMGAYWHVEITSDYFKWKYGDNEWAKIEANKAKRDGAMKQIRTEIEAYLTGPDSKGKIIITGCMYDRNTGKKIPGITFTSLENKIKQGDWIPELQQYIANIFYGMGVDPSTIGVGNQGNTMNSGSEKKSAFWNTQATLFNERLITLMPINFISRYNGWFQKGIRFGYADVDTSQPLSENPTGRTNVIKA